MGKRILNELKQWTKGEIIFYSIVFGLFALTICIAGAILDFRVHFMIFGLIGMIAFILAIKKTFIGYVLLIICLVPYAILAYINNYFSEVFIAGLFILPHLIVEMIRWIQSKTDQPKLPQGKKFIMEIVVTVILAVMLVIGAYKLFYIVQNSWLIGSAFAVCAAALFLYFTTYAEKFISRLFLLVYIALATTSWIFCAVFTDISYAAIALSMIAITFMSIRALIVQTVLFVKERKQETQQADNNKVVEEQSKDEQIQDNKQSTEAKPTKSNKTTPKSTKVKAAKSNKK